jgi:hypothetical protein
VVNVSEICPGTDVPFICHTYVGAVPPFVGVAVKVTPAPAQIDVWLAETDIDGVTLALTVIVKGVLLAVGVVVQFAFEVITTVTISLFASVAEVKAGLFDPAFEPLTLH